MASIDPFIPFVLKWAAGVTRRSGESLTALFERAKKTGWSDDPLDAGGATQCDVTIATYTTYCRNRKLPAPTKATLRQIPYGHWRDIIKSMYWDRWRADEIKSQSVAEILVDWIWASGTTGIKRPQKLLGLSVDGIVGPNTLSAVNAADPAQLFIRLKSDRVKFCYEIVYRKPSQKKWLAGWVNRIYDIKYTS